MTLKTSLVLAGDASGAEAALANAERAMAGATKEAEQLKSSFERVDAATSRLASAQGVAAAETARLKAELATGKLSAEQYNRELLETKTALSLVSSAHAKSVADLKASQAAFDAAASGARNNVSSLRQAQAGYTNLGRQVQDVAVQLQSGTNIGTIVAQQGGQIADAVAQMGGRFSGLAAFLSGPWGAAVIVGAGLLLNLTSALRDNASASEDAEKASEGFAKRLSDMASFFDLSTGAILRQNVALIENARLKRLDQVDEARARQKERGSRIAKLVSESASDQYENRGSIADPLFVSAGRDMTIVNAIRKAGGDQQRINQELLGLARGKGETAKLARQILDERGQAAYDASEIRRLTLEEQSLRTGQLAGDLRKGAPKPRTSQRGDRGAAARAAAKAEFAEDAASKIANIRDQFSDMPTAVEKANKAMRQLDDIASDIERRKLVDGDKLAAEIGTAKKAIEDSLNKPFNDYMEQQRASAEIDKLLLQGREDEAEALRIVLQLQAKQGPLSKQQLEAVLATVQAHRQVNMVLRDQQALIQVNLDAVYDLRGALEESFGSLASGKGFSIDNIVKSIGDSYAKIAGKRIVENLFGKALRDLEEQASGVKSVRTAGEQIEASFKKAGSAADALATAFLAAGGKISGASPVAGGSAAQSDGAATTEDIVVEGRKQTGLIERMVTELQQSGEIVRDSVTALLDPVLAELNQIFGTRFFSELSSAISGAMYGYATGGIPGGILGGLKEIKGLPESLSKGLGKALGGAQTGTVVSGIANAVGIKLSKTGSQIGGAIGSVIPGVGPVIGSIVGGILGK
ncbi:MAG: phage tail length tape measure family protein, partial [Pseudomonadota bacterium]|nr:phage tail length tape measure family protein [Pseudomonadota bacterium]